MNIHQIRNATIVLTYADKKFLIDPFFADKGSMPPFSNTPNMDKRNPLVELPVSVDEIKNVDAVIVTHLHPDHFDEKAKESLPKDLPIFAQNEADRLVIKEAGFQNVETFENGAAFGEVNLIHTDGQHGSSPEIVERMGTVSGIVFTHPDEKTLYVAGDSIFYDAVKEAIAKHQPQVIIVNGGAAQFLEGGPITMTKEDIYQTHQQAPKATIIVSHMESLNHCLLSRAELKQFIAEKGASDHVVIPDDGEQLSY
ncbi:MBL fold metallo-hydrolase [Pseudalkalibacillus caeni]|uniref:MBL fold metallo-hydrolase n=1 Tax=Exobacillus caeni TaxID=2574798 RepID=A0A5R9F2L0_9BACL|nr:MBL fold metallo-hydrolase [Pseudalkalibacillus caeni]TLS36546.1 MBL fold metallo-hydrolase [Pseudalkalibacillus caeni]